MIKRGPVDVLVFALGEPRFDGSILRELEKQTSSGTIRVLDVMVLYKTETGECLRVDMEDLAADDLAALTATGFETLDLFDSEDADTLWEGMLPDTAVIALAIEHAWAVDFVNVLEDAGIEVALNFRVPAIVIDEALAALDA